MSGWIKIHTKEKRKDGKAEGRGDRWKEGRENVDKYAYPERRES